MIFTKYSYPNSESDILISHNNETMNTKQFLILYEYNEWT